MWRGGRKASGARGNQSRAAKFYEEEKEEEKERQEEET